MTWCATNINESPLYNGQISGIGPRYCPSLEDKIMRFPDRERHQIYLEPEGVDGDEIYVNGFSMSLPRDVQEQLVRALPGLEDAQMIRPGYAVEYDFVQPTELKPTLETHASPACFSPARSTARPVRRGGGARSDGGNQRGASGHAARQPSCSDARRRISAFLLTTWSRADVSSRIGCSRRGPSIGCFCASTTRIFV